MANKSRQSQADEEKTISLKITGLRQLRFAVLEPHNGLIDVVNTLDNGRVCTLRVDDFNSLGDAKAYAEVIRVAPELLDHYIADHETLKEVLGRMEKTVGKKKGKQNGKNKGE